MKSPLIGEPGEKHTVSKRCAAGITAVTLSLGVATYTNEIIGIWKQLGADVAEMLGHLK